MSYRIVATRGVGCYLIALAPNPRDRDALGVVVSAGVVAGEPLPLQSILARGYWDDTWSGTHTPGEEAAIVNVVPRDLPTHYSPNP